MGHTWQLPFLEMGTKKNSEAGWVWLPANLTGGAGGGAYSKLFRNDSLTAPDLLAREVLQNSWDAALTRTDDDAPPFRFRFRFATLTGSQRSSFSEVLDLKSLVDRRQFIHDDRNMPPMETVEQLHDERHRRFNHGRLVRFRQECVHQLFRNSDRNCTLTV